MTNFGIQMSQAKAIRGSKRPSSRPLHIARHSLNIRLLETIEIRENFLIGAVLSTPYRVPEDYIEVFS